MGNRDVECTIEGLNAARTLGSNLSGNGFTLYFTSPLLRSRDTLSCIFPRAQVTVHQGLKERGLGDWEGKSKAEVQLEFPQAFLPSGKMDPRFTPPNGESLPNFLGRVQSFLDYVSTLKDEEHVVAVTHNGVIRAMRHLIQRMPVEMVFAASEPFLSPTTFNVSRLNELHELSKST